MLAHIPPAAVCPFVPLWYECLHGAFCGGDPGVGGGHNYDLDAFCDGHVVCDGHSHGAP